MRHKTVDAGKLIEGKLYIVRRSDCEDYHIAIYKNGKFNPDKWFICEPFYFSVAVPLDLALQAENMREELAAYGVSVP